VVLSSADSRHRAMARLLLLMSLCLIVMGARVDLKQKLSSSGKTRESLQSKLGTVTSVNLEAFLGRWYQMYGSISSTILTFGNAGPQDLCTSADYSLNKDGSTIDVLNQGIRLDGRVTKIFGQARATEESGKKKLVFNKFLRGNQTIKPPDFEGDFWIFRLGPRAGRYYEYAIVAGPASPRLGLDKTQLFVLVRNPKTYLEQYDSEVLEWLAKNGWSWWWNRPRKTGSIGKFQWFPYPTFASGDGSRGKYGQDGCAKVKELSPPVDGFKDPRE